MIATLGPEYSYTHIAAQAAYPTKKILLVKSIHAALDKIESGEASTAFVPIENMLHGSVRETLTALLKHEVSIEKAFMMEIHHCLAAQGNEFEKIASKQEALNQCEKYLKKPTISTASTSEALKMASQDPKIAAIGARKAAEHYGLKVLAENIEDHEGNRTRFIAATKAEPGSKGARTSMAITPTEDRPGLLFEILAVFKIKNINLTKIESVPTGNKMGEYNFFVDIDGSVEEQNVQDALKFLNTIVKVKNLGSYSIETIKTS